MKQLIFRTILAAAAAFSATAAHAQILTARVPFQFYVNGALMPEGKYELRIDRAPNQVVLRNMNGRKMAMSFFNIADVPTNLRGAGKPSMMFDCNGAHCVLFEVWEGSGTSGLELSTPKLRTDPEMRVIGKEIRVIHAD